MFRLTPEGEAEVLSAASAYWHFCGRSVDYGLKVLGNIFPGGLLQEGNIP
jgi:hypothetical protein